MKKNTFLPLLAVLAIICQLSVVLPACRENADEFDATGSFEATETMVPAQGSGIIRELSVQEGQSLDSGQQVGVIDSTQLYLKKKQLEAQIRSMGYQLPDIEAQTAPFKQQAAVTQSRLDYLLNERKRTENLLRADAATPKQLDDLNAQIEQARLQIKTILQQGTAQASALNTRRSGLSAGVQPLYIEVQQVEDLLQKSKIINPLAGTVLTKFAEVGEMATTGKPLYTIADLTSLLLRAYITSDQFSFIKLGQEVKVLVDDTSGRPRQYKGKIEWISDKAEFTPKTIQTKKERADLVYAIKIRVINDGTLKIGMYGEVKFK